MEIENERRVCRAITHKGDPIGAIERHGLKLR